MQPGGGRGVLSANGFEISTLITIRRLYWIGFLTTFTCCFYYWLPTKLWISSIRMYIIFRMNDTILFFNASFRRAYFDVYIIVSRLIDIWSFNIGWLAGEWRGLTVASWWGWLFSISTGPSAPSTFQLFYAIDISNDVIWTVRFPIRFERSKYFDLCRIHYMHVYLKFLYNKTISF